MQTTQGLHSRVQPASTRLEMLPVDEARGPKSSQNDVKRALLRAPRDTAASRRGTVQRILTVCHSTKPYSLAPTRISPARIPLLDSPHGSCGESSRIV